MSSTALSARLNPASAASKSPQHVPFSCSGMIVGRPSAASFVIRRVSNPLPRSPRRQPSPRTPGQTKCRMAPDASGAIREGGLSDAAFLIRCRRAAASSRGRSPSSSKKAERDPRGQSRSLPRAGREPRRCCAGPHVWMGDDVSRLRGAWPCGISPGAEQYYNARCRVTAVPCWIWRPLG